LLAYALSRDRGSYQDALRAEILEPLRMNSTTISVDQADQARMARGYASGLRLGPIMFARRAGPLADHSPLVGAGAVRSTAADMLKYLKANMGMTSGPLHDAVTRSHRQLFRSAESGSIGTRRVVDDLGVTLLQQMRPRAPRADTARAPAAPRASDHP
jgi:CubicO group peptidase (beta-lactamase class C family)